MTEAERAKTTKGGFHVVFQDDIAILTMDIGENRFDKHFIDAFNSNLDQVEQNENCRILITTGSNKYFSNGLDLAYVSSLDRDGLRKFYSQLRGLLYRVLTFPLITVAAINGHVFAGGAFLAMCHDYQVMGSCRGWWSLPEVFIGIRLSHFFQELAKAKLPIPALHQAAFLGRRFTGDEALEAGIISRVVAGPVLPQALMMAREVYPKDGYDREKLQAYKVDAYEHTVRNDKDIEVIDSKL